MNICLWNAQSVRNKTTFLSDYIIYNDIDIVFLTETWLNESESVVMGECTPPGYTFLNYPGGTSDHGGIAIITKSSVNFHHANSKETFTTFEYVSVIDPVRSIQFFIVYRPPPSKVNKLKASTFLEEFDDFLGEVALLPLKLVILGDFNTHVDQPMKWDSRRLLSTVETCGFYQYVYGPTHRSLHTLDLVIARLDDNVIDHGIICEDFHSDHNMIHCYIGRNKPSSVKKTVTLRDFRSLNHEQFESDLSSELASLSSIDEVNHLVTQFDSTVRCVLDRHAPLRTKTRTIRPCFPWYNDQIAEERRLRRQCERKWRKTKSLEDRQAYANQKSLCNKAIEVAKVSYYKDKLQNASNKEVFRTVNTLLNKDTRVFPACNSNKELCDQFANFFHNKVAKIRRNLDVDSDGTMSSRCDVSSQSVVSSDHMLSEFSLLSKDDVRSLCSKSTTKSCQLDPIPTWLLKKHIDVMLPSLTHIINLSLASGIFPKLLGHAIISPIIKKVTLDSNELQNYRPVSNIAYISKLIEKVVTKQITDHMSLYNLGEQFQSAYTANTSTETALLKVKSDMLCAVDRQEVVFLVLLDLSAAFDTVDHSVLLHRLQQRTGICGTALKWIDSYLKSRTSCVCIEGEFSAATPLLYGVPQGSVKGPLDFIIYTLPVGDIIRSHNLDFHVYADDVQVYISFNPKEPNAAMEALRKLELCIMDLKNWMKTNKLMLNNNKTEFFIAGSRQSIQRLPPVQLQVGDSTIMPSCHIRNLGVMFDTHMTMSKQVSAIVSSANYQLRNLWRLHRYLDQETRYQVVRALILSRLDYGNALLYGITSKELKRLQSIQNKSAKFIFSASRRDSPAPLLHSLHWLPVRERIFFKLCLYVYKSLNGHAPQYLTDSLKAKSRPLQGPVTRSASDNTLLVVPPTRTQNGDKAFCCRRAFHMEHYSTPHS